MASIEASPVREPLSFVETQVEIAKRFGQWVTDNPYAPEWIPPSARVPLVAVFCFLCLGLLMASSSPWKFARAVAKEASATLIRPTPRSVPGKPGVRVVPSLLNQNAKMD